MLHPPQMVKKAIQVCEGLERVPDSKTKFV